MILFKKLYRFIEFLSHIVNIRFTIIKRIFPFFYFSWPSVIVTRRMGDNSTIIKKWLAFATLVRTIIESVFGWTLITMIDVYHTCITCISYTRNKNKLTDSHIIDPRVTMIYRQDTLNLTLGLNARLLLSCQNSHNFQQMITLTLICVSKKELKNLIPLLSYFAFIYVLL